MDEIATLKSHHHPTTLSESERQQLRQSVEKIIKKREQKDRELNRAEMERLYEFNLHS